MGVAYGDMAWHIDLIVLYDWVDGSVENVEVLVVETWRVASRQRSSTTRNYIGAVDTIADLRAERGEFGTIEEFYGFWRAHPIRLATPLPEPEAVEPQDLLGG